MANLLNWSGGLSIRKKEDENTQAPLINSLRTLNPAPVKTNSFRPIDAASLRNNVSTNSSGVTDAFARAQQVNDQMRQQAEQRRQEEERRRQEQEQRRQQEEARRAQEQQAQQQKQQNLLKSSLQGGSLLNNLANNGPTGEKMANQINKSLALSDTIAKGQANMNTRQAEKQRQLNEAETNRLTKAYTNQINQNTNLLNSVRSGEEKLNNNAFNKLSQDAFKGNFNQPEPALRLSNNLSERSVENQVKGDEDILERIKNGSRPITLGQGLKMLAEDKLEQGLGNAILGEQTEDEDFGKQMLRNLINIPGSTVGEPLRLAGLLQDAGNPNGTKNVIEKNSDGTASINAKENETLNRLGSAAEVAMIPISMFAGGATANVAKTIAKGLAKTSLKDAGKQIAKTGLEEAAQEAGQNLAQELSEEGKWDEGTLGRTAQAAAMGGIAGGLVSGITSGAGAINDRLRSRQTDNATNVAQNTEVNTTNAANNGIDISQIRKTNDGQLVKQDANGTTTRLSDAELADTIDQNNNTQQNTNSFQNNALNLRSSTDDVNTMSRRASQGDTYAQQRLAELTNQNQEENTNWRGNSVNEVIAPERNETNVAQSEIRPNETIQNEQQLTTQEEGQNTLQNASNDFGGRTFDELTPVEQEEWLANNSNQVPSETQLAQALRQMGIDPTGMSQLDMLREYSRAVNNTAPEVRTANEIENNPEVLPSERNVAERTAPTPVAISTENLAQEPAVPTRTDTVGTGEGTTEASTRIPTTQELSAITPEELGIDTSKLAPQMFDEKGDLMVMHHGTPNGGFERFNDGSYFTPDIDYASRYLEPSASSMAKSGIQKATNPMMYDTYLDIRNPFDLNDKAARDIFINDYVKGGNAIGINPYLSDAEYQAINNLDWTEVESLREFLQDNGYDYDAIIANEGGDLVDGKVVPRGQSFVPFSGDQVRIIPQNIAEDTSIRTPDSQSVLSDKIDEVLGNRNYRQPVMLRESTPEVLVKLGIKDLPMYENPAHIRNNILTEGEAKRAGVFRNGDNYHGLGKDVYMDAINGLDVPRAVFKRNDGSNDFMILTAVKDGYGNTVIVPIEIETTTMANNVSIDTNRVKTVFGYDDNAGLDRYIKNNIRNNAFTKIDTGAGVIAPAAASNGSVSQNGSNVNTNNPIYQYYQKYGEDFYEKMPDNLKEKYEEMLDMQPRDGQGRYTDPITGETWIDEEAGTDTNAKSSFAENTSANNNFSEETRRALKNDPISYTPTTNEERLARANEILSTKTPDEVDNYLRDNFFNVKAKNASSEDMVLAGEFAKMLDARGQYDRSTEIINKMSEIGTKQGQNIQAMSLMTNRSPEGIANMAQNAIKKGGGEMNGEVRRQIVEKTQEIGRTRGERAKLAERNDAISQQIMNGEGDLKALRKEQMQIAQAYRQNLDQEGRQFAQLTDVVSKNSPDSRSIFGSVWRAGLLSGPRTHTGNALSNTFQNVLNAGSDRIASGLDWARAKVTGTEREVVGSDMGLRARGKGLKRGLSAAKEVLKTGDNLWEGTDIVTGKTTAWGQGGELEFKNKVANNMVAKPTNYVFRAMSAGDLPFRYAAFENAIRTEAKRQGINQGYKGQALQDYINSRVATPDPELQAYGIRKGNESVYDIDTKLSDVMNRVDKFIDGQENKLVKNGLKGVKTLVAPFVKVPSKVLSTAIDYSPLGSVKAIVNKVGSKGYTTAQFETDLAKSGLGTAGFVGLGYALSAAGLLTGGYPDSADERNRWKAEGIEPNSIKIGDTYLSLNYLGPASMLMAMGSGVQQRQAKGEDALSIAQGTVMDTLNTFLDQSYVQGLSNALNAITDSNRYGESYVNSFARGLVPNLLRQTATATDPMQRQVNNAGEAVVSGIPGASQNLDAKVDTYGREIENKQTLPLGQMWDALKLSNSRKTNSVIDEVNRLHNVDPNNKDLQVTPPKEDNTLSVNGQNVKITDAQKTQLQKDTGNAAITAMRQVMQSEKYASLSDQEKAKALDKARSDAQTEARKKFIEVNNITANNNPGTKNSGGSTVGNYANMAISKATTNNQGKSAVTISNDLAKEYSNILDKYNSMSSDDWNKYIYGDTAESAAAEYKLAKAKYENDLANGSLTDVQKIKRQKELDKLEVSQKWTKDYRDAYSLAGTKSDMQEFLNAMDDETRAKTVAVLNGLNNAMLEAGIIKESTYKTRYNAINNTSSSKSSGGRKKGSGRKSGSGSNGISSAEASAMSSLAKTMVKNTNKGTTKTAKAPETKRKMARTKSSGNKTNLATYTPSNKKVTVSKGAKQSIA